MGDAMTTQDVRFTGDGGEDVQAYLAVPSEPGSRGGVLVIHHLPGWDRGTKEIARRLAELGHNAICPNLYWREAPDASAEEAAAIARENGGVPDERLIGDAAGAVAYLRALPTSNGRAAVIGFCSGGRQSVLTACNVDVDAAIDCYGALVVGEAPEGFPLKIGNIVGHLPNLRCPLLGVFGNEDSNPSPADVDELDRLLDEHGKPHEFHRYDGAGHAFLAVNRSAYRPEPANDAWERIATFLAAHLDGEPS